MTRRYLIAISLTLAAAMPAVVVPGAGAASLVPTVTTSNAGHATYSSVTVYGYVNAHGIATGYAFQYGTTTGYGGQTALAPAGEKKNSVKVGQTIDGLQPGTVYHYRIVAVNGAGLAYGGDRTFKTVPVPLSLQITSTPNPVTYGEPFLIEGNLSGTGAAGREVILEANPYPFMPGFHTIGNPELTSATGAFSFPYLGLLENTQLRVATVGGGTIVASPVVVENVAVRVTFRARRARRRGYWRLSGTVTPSEAGALVGFQLLKPGNSVNEGGTGVKPGTATTSRFERVVRIKHPGVYRALVKVNDPARVSGYSPPIYIR
ncbi:MAG TPA: fibronectin type III domain-containing protein [Solirubrobacteraceae bacterium]|nr:fibronectin type III domain-containing protein [Solirubrobacteraceae bacterium]